MPIPTIDDRQLATDAAFSALLMALNDAGVLPVARLHYHLSRAVMRFDEEALPEAAVALDELRQHTCALLPPRGAMVPSSRYEVLV